MRVLSFLLALFAAAGLPLAAAELQPEPTPAPAIDTTLPSEIDPAVAAAEELFASLGKPTDLVLVDGAVLWQHPQSQQRWTVVGANRGRAEVDTAIGRVAVDHSLLDRGDAVALDTFAGLLQHAAAAELGQADGDSGFRYTDSILTGLRLRSRDALVVPEGLLYQEDVTHDRADEIAAAATLGQTLIAALRRDLDDELVLQALAEVITTATQPPLENIVGDEVTPFFARQIINHGWLQLMLPGRADTELYAKAISKLLQPQAYRSYRGPGGLLQQVGNAFEATGWIVQTERRNLVAVHPPRPENNWDARATVDEVMTVMELPIGPDPIAHPDTVTDALQIRLHHGDRLLAWWSQEAGFGADQEAWRAVYREAGGRLPAAILGGHFPPHLLINDLYGDLHQLICAHGSLTAPTEYNETTSEEFLKQAAQVLRDAEHLDLLGQYFFKYVYDSPEPTMPLLVGTRTNNGDIHQTALQTLQTFHGGRCRGDCDDLAELYHNIVERQGKLPHVISLPGHAALAWAEEHPDGWHTIVMQTGPTYEFVAPQIQDSLAAAYRHFDSSDTFDPNGLGLLLRFSGENTRSSWRLSYRIFTEPEYAETMIDVQRDWHYQTYLQGIRKMEELIAAGDDDTANYRELAGLFQFTGQYSKAADYKKMAIDRTSEATSRLFETAEWISHLFKAERTAEAVTATEEVVDLLLPALQKELGTAAIQYGLTLASTLMDNDMYDLAHRVLAATVDPEVDKMLVSIPTWLQNNFDRDVWQNSPQLRTMRRLLSMYSGLALMEVLSRGGDGLGEDSGYQAMYRRLQRYHDHIAMYHDEEPWQWLGTYASIGHGYRSLLGDASLLNMLEEVESAKDLDYVHTRRIGGLAQVGLDLPWIRLSPQFFAGMLGDLQEEESAIDRAWVERLRRHLLRARDESRALGWDSPFLRNQIHQAELVAALLLEDRQRLEQLLAEVKHRDDKRLRDATAQTIGSWAAHCSEAWFADILATWVGTADYKPKYYLIAWQAKLQDAPQRALQAARVAAERFADDQDFVDEYAFMQELLVTVADTSGPSKKPALEEAREEDAVFIPLPASSGDELP